MYTGLLVATMRGWSRRFLSVLQPSKSCCAWVTEVSMIIYHVTTMTSCVMWWPPSKPIPCHIATKVRVELEAAIKLPQTGVTIVRSSFRRVVAATPAQEYQQVVTLSFRPSTLRLTHAPIHLTSTLDWWASDTPHYRFDKKCHHRWRCSTATTSTDHSYDVFKFKESKNFKEFQRFYRRLR